MRIKNVTTGNIIISDLPNGQGFGVSVPTLVEVLIFNEDAEKSVQLGSFLDAGLIVNLGPEEPSTGTSQAVTQPAVVGAFPVSVTNEPVTGYVIGADSTTTASWKPAASVGIMTFVDAEVPAGVVDGVNTIFTLASIPTAGSTHLYKNGLRQRPAIDYTIVGQTVTFAIAPDVSANLLADYRF